MLTRIHSMQLNGIAAQHVIVEIDVSNGLPNFTIVGQADLTVKESKERIRIAIGNSGFSYPLGRITVNLCPADTRKKGSQFDLAIAMGILCSSEQVYCRNLEEYGFIGELSLDGCLSKTKGILPMVMGMRESGIKKVFVPKSNEKESAFVSGIEILPAEKIEDVVMHITNVKKLKPVQYEKLADTEQLNFDMDFGEVKGQEEAKRAIMIGVSGKHGIFMLGTPGSGKTMLAERIPTIMPELTMDEIIETTAIYSISGLLDESNPYISKPPFRQPHYKTTLAGMIGGGKYPLPGEISLAHKGVLFLDEIGEFNGSILESLRTPLESKNIALTRNFGTIKYPCDCIFIAASNPCKCGYCGSSVNECTCTREQIINYQRKFSGPIIDRIDMHIVVNEVNYQELENDTGLDSYTMKKTVERVRNIQKERYAGESFSLNSQLTNNNIDVYAPLGKKEKDFLEEAYRTFRLNPRTLVRVRKLSRTIADLEGSENIQIKHIAESLKFREVGIND